MVEDVLRAYQKLGGVGYLVKLGKKAPELFVAMLKRLVPNKIDAEAVLHAVCAFPDKPGHEAAEKSAKKIDEKVSEPE